MYEITKAVINCSSTLERENITFDVGNSTFGIRIIMALSTLVGAWGVVCLINGLVMSENISKNLITAFTGM